MGLGELTPGRRPFHESGSIVMLEDLIKCTVVLDVLLGVHWSKLLNLIVWSIAVSIPHSFMYMASMNKSISWGFVIISFGISMRSLLTGLGLRLVDLPFKLDMSGPNIFLDMLTSSTVTGQF
jgi:hypothetical protein